MYKDKVREKLKELKNKKDIIVLGIESSCDETSIAVVKNGREILAPLRIDIKKTNMVFYIYR